MDRDELADDQTGQIRIRVGELAQRAAGHKDYLLGQLLINGGTGGHQSYDGATFFSHAHVAGSSAAQDNDLTLDVAAGDGQPTTEEFRDSLRRAISQILCFKDDQDEPVTLSTGGLVCVVPPMMLYTAMEAVSATLVSQTSNVLQGAASVISLPWLASPSTWYLLKTDGVLRPFIFQDREPIEFGALTEASEEGFKREKLLFGVRARYRLTYGYGQYAVRTVFA